MYAGVHGPEIDSHWHALEKDRARQSQGEKASSSTSNEEWDVVVPVVKKVRWVRVNALKHVARLPLTVKYRGVHI